nr:hypothetical protein [uncultured Methanobacterium sp.]
MGVRTTIDSNIDSLAAANKVRATKVKAGVIKGLDETGKFGERQMKAIHGPHSKSGKILRSIKWIKTGEYSRTVGVFTNEIYPLILEKGRGPIYPKLRVTPNTQHVSYLGKHIGAAALKFEIGGKVIFRRSVGPAKPRPYVEPTRRSMRTMFPKIMQKEIANAIQTK